MEKDVFVFKGFDVAHGRSAMKVGVDAVLLGAWVRAYSPSRILDAGTGCGIISLILAQRFSEALILGIDIDEASVKEATDNFRNSKWKERLKAEKNTFPDDLQEIGLKFDLIVSNPPFFDSGLKPITPRELARHQASLSVFTLLKHSNEFLTENGKLAFIFPASMRDKVMASATETGLALLRECEVRNNEAKPVKRIMMEFQKGCPSECEPLKTMLTLFRNGQPTEDYIALCKDLYLKF